MADTEDLESRLGPILGALVMAIARQLDPARQKKLCDELYTVGRAMSDQGDASGGRLLQSLSNAVQVAAPETFEKLGRAQHRGPPS